MALHRWKIGIYWELLCHKHIGRMLFFYQLNLSIECCSKSEISYTVPPEVFGCVCFVHVQYEMQQNLNLVLSNLYSLGTLPHKRGINIIILPVENTLQVWMWILESESHFLVHLNHLFMGAWNVRDDICLFGRLDWPRLNIRYSKKDEINMSVMQPTPCNPCY